ncbi:mucin-12 isoform X2 [Hyalella azteca]|uniref:Mucin-12 isoform X2 n=1 Tax=Hyalella azteca TaxID=294128 RepID=A0A8B7PKD7_HYAAZ|nr:mucin-12 isoform X2 [Hyalella azteca]
MIAMWRNNASVAAFSAIVLVCFNVVGAEASQWRGSPRYRKMGRISSRGYNKVPGFNSPTIDLPPVTGRDQNSDIDHFLSSISSTFAWPKGPASSSYSLGSTTPRKFPNSFSMSTTSTELPNGYNPRSPLTYKPITNIKLLEKLSAAKPSGSKFQTNSDAQISRTSKPHSKFNFGENASDDTRIFRGSLTSNSHSNFPDAHAAESQDEMNSFPFFIPPHSDEHEIISHSHLFLKDSHESALEQASVDDIMSSLMTGARDEGPIVTTDLNYSKTGGADSDGQNRTLNQTESLEDNNVTISHLKTNNETNSFPTPAQASYLLLKEKHKQSLQNQVMESEEANPEESYVPSLSVPLISGSLLQLKEKFRNQTNTGRPVIGETKEKFNSSGANLQATSNSQELFPSTSEFAGADGIYNTLIVNQSDVVDPESTQSSLSVDKNVTVVPQTLETILTEESESQISATDTSDEDSLTSTEHTLSPDSVTEVAVLAPNDLNSPSSGDPKTNVSNSNASNDLISGDSDTDNHDGIDVTSINTTNVIGQDTFEQIGSSIDETTASSGDNLNAEMAGAADNQSSVSSQEMVIVSEHTMTDNEMKFTSTNFNSTHFNTTASVGAETSVPSSTEDTVELPLTVEGSITTNSNDATNNPSDHSSSQSAASTTTSAKPPIIESLKPENQTLDSIVLNLPLNSSNNVADNLNGITIMSNTNANSQSFGSTATSQEQTLVTSSYADGTLSPTNITESISVTSSDVSSLVQEIPFTPNTTPIKNSSIIPSYLPLKLQFLELLYNQSSSKIPLQATTTASQITNTLAPNNTNDADYTTATTPNSITTEVGTNTFNEGINEAMTLLVSSLQNTGDKIIHGNSTNNNLSGTISTAVNIPATSENVDQSSQSALMPSEAASISSFVSSTSDQTTSSLPQAASTSTQAASTSSQAASTSSQAATASSQLGSTSSQAATASSQLGSTSSQAATASSQLGSTSSQAASASFQNSSSQINSTAGESSSTVTPTITQGSSSVLKPTILSQSTGSSIISIPVVFSTQPPPTTSKSYLHLKEKYPSLEFGQNQPQVTMSKVTSEPTMITMPSSFLYLKDNFLRSTTTKNPLLVHSSNPIGYSSATHDSDVPKVDITMNEFSSDTISSPATVKRTTRDASISNDFDGGSLSEEDNFIDIDDLESIYLVTSRDSTLRYTSTLKPPMLITFSYLNSDNNLNAFREDMNESIGQSKLEALIMQSVSQKNQLKSSTASFQSITTAKPSSTSSSLHLPLRDKLQMGAVVAGGQAGSSADTLNLRSSLKPGHIIQSHKEGAVINPVPVDSVFLPATSSNYVWQERPDHPMYLTPVDAASRTENPEIGAPVTYLPLQENFGHLLQNLSSDTHIIDEDYFQSTDGDFGSSPEILAIDDYVDTTKNDISPTVEISGSSANNGFPEEDLINNFIVEAPQFATDESVVPVSSLITSQERTEMFLPDTPNVPDQKLSPFVDLKIKFNSTTMFNSNHSNEMGGSTANISSFPSETIPISNYSYNDPFRPNFDILEQLSTIVKYVQEDDNHKDSESLTENLVVDPNSGVSPENPVLDPNAFYTAGAVTYLNNSHQKLRPTNEQQDNRLMLLMYQQHFAELERQQNLLNSEIFKRNSSQNPVMTPRTPELLRATTTIRPLNKTALSQQLLRTPNPYSTITASSAPTRSPAHDKECLNPSVRYSCASCGAMVMCIGTEAYLYACNYPKETCHRDPIFGGGVCRRTMNPECSCVPGDSVKPDPYDYRAFANCFGTLEMSMGTCLEDEELHPLTEECSPIPEMPHCHDLGTFPNPNDCRWYYVCLWPSHSGNYKQTLVRCPHGQLFSSVQRVCMSPEDMPQFDACEGIHFESLIPISSRPPHIFTDDVNLTTLGEMNSNSRSDQNATDGNTEIDSDVLIVTENYAGTETLTSSSSSSTSPTTSTTQATTSTRAPVVRFNPTVRAVPAPPAAIPTTTTTTTTTVATTESPRTYTCPLIVALVIYWYPDIVSMACSIT